jgi:hypothetical protein
MKTKQKLPAREVGLYRHQAFAPSQPIRQAIIVRPDVIRKSLLALSLFFILMNGISILSSYYLLPASGISRSMDHHFNLDNEFNFPSYFSSLLLLSSSFLLLVIAAGSRGAGTFKGQWKSLSVIFLFLMLDETFQLHERLAEPMRKLFATGLPSFLHQAWVIPYSIICMIGVAHFYRFFFQLHRPTMTRFFVAGCIYVGAAIGVEMVEGIFLSRYAQESIQFRLATSVQETGEMIGIVLFIDALMRYMSMKNINLSVSTRGEQLPG